MKTIDRWRFVAAASAALLALSLRTWAEDGRQTAPKLGQAPGPVFETAEQIIEMPDRQATVKQKAPCFVFLETAEGEGFYVGSPGSPAEVAHFLGVLQEGNSYRFPDVFLQYRKKMVREIVGTVSGAGWPETIANLVNGNNRFYGTEFVPCLESTFFYAGDAALFNAFLKSISQLAGTQLVIHPGSKQVAPESAPEFLKSVDWQLEVDRTPVTSSAVRLLEGNNLHLEIPLRVHLWLGGQIKWDDVEVPAGIRVQSASELEDFIRRHNAQLEEALGKQ